MGVTTLAAYAAPVIASGVGTLVAAAVDARHGAVFFQVFGPAGRTVVTPRIVSIRDAARQLGSGPVRVIGSGAELLAAEARAIGLEVTVEGARARPASSGWPGSAQPPIRERRAQALLPAPAGRQAAGSRPRAPAVRLTAEATGMGRDVWGRDVWSWLTRPSRPAVRLLSGGDAGRIAAIHAQGFHLGWSVPEIEAMLADPAVTGLGIGRGRALEGFVLSRRAADEAEILTIAVAAGARRSGLGQALLLAHLAQLARAGVRALFLEVDEGNAAARALYDRLGFHQVGRRNAYYPRSDGSRAAALVLRREIA